MSWNFAQKAYPTFTYPDPQGDGWYGERGRVERERAWAYYIRFCCENLSEKRREK